MDIFTRLIWTATAQHTAVDYPIAAYGAFTPNIPTKLYDDDRVAPDVFNPYRLPNGVLAAVSRWFYHFTPSSSLVLHIQGIFVVVVLTMSENFESRSSSSDIVFDRHKLTPRLFWLEHLPHYTSFQTQNKH